jgi:hypothetical protein
LSETKAESSPANHVGLVSGMPETGRNGVHTSYFRGPKVGWWDAVDEDALVNDALTYVELESEAEQVRTFKIDLIDGLLQTAEYAAAVVRANLPLASEDLVRRRVEARAHRQERLTGEHPIHIEAVLTEGALRNQVGGPHAMRRQLEWLLELGSLPHISLRVVPATGAYPAMGTPFYILSFTGGYSDIGYVELLDKGVYLDKPDDVEPYVTKFASLLRVALSQRKSGELIGEIARGQC